MIFRSFQNIVRHFGPKKKFKRPPKRGVGGGGEGCLHIVNKERADTSIFFQTNLFFTFARRFSFYLKNANKKYSRKMARGGPLRRVVSEPNSSFFCSIFASIQSNIESNKVLHLYTGEVYIILKHRKIILCIKLNGKIIFGKK